MIQGNWQSSTGRDHLDISDDHNLPPASHPDVHLLLQGDESSLEIHQEHVGSHQHEVVGSERSLRANLLTESLRGQARSQTETLHNQAKVAIINQANKKVICIWVGEGENQCDFCLQDILPTVWRR